MSININEQDLALVEQLGIDPTVIRTLFGRDTSTKSPHQSGLSEHEKQLLKQGGARIPENEERLEIKKRHARALIAECKSLLEHSMDSREVSKLLEVPEEQVERMARQSPRRLQSIMLRNGQLRFPAWQFTDSGMLPSLELLLTIPGFSENPVKVSRFMCLSNSELEVEGQCLSPREWLLNGLDIHPILAELQTTILD